MKTYYYQFMGPKPPRRKTGIRLKRNVFYGGASGASAGISGTQNRLILYSEAGGKDGGGAEWQPGVV